VVIEAEELRKIEYTLFLLLNSLKIYQLSRMWSRENERWKGLSREKDKGGEANTINNEKILLLNETNKYMFAS
jgi:hypothetical protein